MHKNEIGDFLLANMATLKIRLICLKPKLNKIRLLPTRIIVAELLTRHSTLRRLW